MPELAFLGRYSGQSVDQLLALEGSYRIDSLVLAFEQALDQKASRVGDDALTDAERTVLAVEALEREVNNGGFHLFFVNLSVEYVPSIVDALLRIGCPRVAAITADAIGALRLPRPSVEDIKAIIHDDNKERDEAIQVCDDRFFEYPEPIADRLFAFIKANRSTVRL